MQIHSLRGPEAAPVTRNRRVPFLMLYAEFMGVLRSGRENATLHGIVHTETAQTLSALTGVGVWWYAPGKIRGNCCAGCGSGGAGCVTRRSKPSSQNGIPAWTAVGGVASCARRYAARGGQMG